ncbi:MAG: cytochrome c biogenesis protein [Pseudomonadales bacterium]|nr:cytochrome c biogenesis protein [Pseudomonadales bacterium]
MNKNHHIYLFFIIFFLFGIVNYVKAQENSQIYFFYGTGCPHCVVVEDFFEKQHLLEKYPIEKKEIYFNKDNAIFFNKILDEKGIPTQERGVPTVIIGDKVFIGDKPILDNFVAESDRFLEQSNLTRTDEVFINENALEEIEIKEKSEPKFESDLTLLVVIGASIVDAINPCAFAVLIILMTTILATGDGKKALKSGIAFASSIFISYFLMGLGLYKALAVGGFSGIFYKVIGWLAFFLGLFNLKDYFWYGKGFLLEVPMTWRPNLKKLIKSVSGPIGAFCVGFIVSLILLPCTSGPYIVILGMLAQNSLQAKAVFYLILYNLIFVSPMILISLAVYKGFDPKKAEEIRQKRLKTLHLIAGILMLAMGLAILNHWI